MSVLLICVLGGLGAAARWTVDGAVRRRWATSFPAGTVAVAVIGFCGGYTTFSTAMADTVRLARDGQAVRAALNAVGTALLTVLAVLAGLATAALPT